MLKRRGNNIRKENTLHTTTLGDISLCLFAFKRPVLPSPHVDVAERKGRVFASLLFGFYFCSNTLSCFLLLGFLFYINQWTLTRTAQSSLRFVLQNTALHSALLGIIDSLWIVASSPIFFTWLAPHRGELNGELRPRTNAESNDR